MVTIAQRGSRSGRPVVSGRMTLPRIGAWVADLNIDADDIPPGPVDLSFDGRTMVGTVTDRSALVEGIVRTRVVAGANGLSNQVSVIHYTTPTVRNVLEHIAADAGESLSAEGDSTILALQLEHWTVLQMPAGAAIGVLVDLLPEVTVWRVLADGGLWIGRDTWPSVSPPGAAVIGERPEDALIELALEVPFLMPGTTVAGRKADTVELSFGAGGVTARVWTVP